MTAGVLLDALRERGVVVEVAGDRLRYRPRDAVPPELRAQLVAHKPGLLALLAEEPPRLEPSLSLVDRLRAMPLDTFQREGQPLEIRVAWWPDTLFFVPSVADMEALRLGGVAAHRVFTAAELLVLLGTPGCTVTVDDLRMVMVARREFDGEVVAVIPRDPQDARE
jgi:hypothetical protein